MNRRILGPSNELLSRLATILNARGYQLPESRHQGRGFAEAVLKLSDHYTASPTATTPWKESWAQIASLVYYLPLNFSRASAVATEARRLGFLDGLKTVLDFGAGHGSATLAFQNQFKDLNYKAFDISNEALELCRQLADPSSRIDTHSCRNADDLASEIAKSSTQTAVMASYSLTELEDFPSSWLKAEALILIEPSTQEDGRRLLKWRERLLSAGFFLWAPCTHQGLCPLFTQSERDWCHDRIHFAAPPWWDAIESHLPMKNKTLTYSYLLARKTPPPVGIRSYARLVGDMLEEKGKTRQALCRGPEREFLAWFPPRLEKNETIELERGSLVKLDDGLEKKSNEVRLKQARQITELASSDSI